MMTRKHRIAIVVLILIVCLLLATWLVFLLTRGESTVTQAPVVEQPPEEEVIPSRPTVSEVELEEEREVRETSSDVLTLSKTFIERYGSYSNEAAFANLRDVLPLMSKSFAAKTQKLIDGGEVPEEYYGVTTRVVTVGIEEKDETVGIATVISMAQREESFDSPQNEKVKYQEIELTFVMEDGAWKVDSANWQ
jgi:hypothetical protein